MQCGNLLHCGGMWAFSLALNGPNAAGVYVAGFEPVPGLSLCETGSVLLDLLTWKAPHSLSLYQGSDLHLI